MKLNKTQKNKSRRKNFRTKKIFHNNNYRSNDGMLTSVWGPSMWHSLHTLSFNYPVKPTLTQKKYYKSFIEAMKYTLPCRHCRENFKLYLKKHPITRKVMDSRHSFSFYIYNLHENINKMLKKKSGLSFEDVRERYEHFRARCMIPVVNKTRKTHKGCTIPLHKFKSKGVIKIIPTEEKCESLEIDKKCNLIRMKQ